MKFKKQSGQVLFGTAAALVVLAGFAGLAIDMGTLRYQKRLQQTAADAAAIAGASNLAFDGTSFRPGALTAATANGFVDNTNGGACGDATITALDSVTVTVCNGPQPVAINGSTVAAGPHAGDTNYVEVVLAKVQPTYFMKIFGIDSRTIVARAVATNTGGGSAGSASCVYTLGTPANQLNFNKAGVGSTGTNYIYAPSCAIVDNGNFVANGNVSVKAASIGVGGGINLPNNSTPDCTQNQPAGVCPTPVAGMPYSGDPFANKYPTPTAGGAGTVTTVGGVTTYSPGTYNGITINSPGNTVFTPGVYVITGAFRINAGANVCAGGVANFSVTPFTCTHNAGSDGATFYLTGGASLTINGGASTKMYAPDSGTYEGLLFYQNPSDSQQATINGNDNSFFQGAIYMPKADVDFSGTATFNSGALYTAIISDQLLVSGGAYVNLNSNFSQLAGGGGPLAGLTKWATLVE
jgi:hypothetical protein